MSAMKTMSDTKFKKMISQIKETGFAPIIIPPFQGPKRENVDKVLKLLKLQSGYRMYLPKYGVKTAEPVPFGYSYVGKLEHMAAEKMHGRSTGPMTTKILQPTAGKRREGGQKVGEGDTWALSSYNAKALMQELFGPMSDDNRSKNEMINEIIETGHAEFKEEPQATPTRDLLNAYFRGLMLEEK
jgi:DNA-directed RNA polymerase subunit beta